MQFYGSVVLEGKLIQDIAQSNISTVEKHSQRIRLSKCSTKGAVGHVCLGTEHRNLLQEAVLSEPGHVLSDHSETEQDPMVLAPPPPPTKFSACLLSVENFSQRISLVREVRMWKQRKTVKGD